MAGWAAPQWIRLTQEALGVAADVHDIGFRIDVVFVPAHFAGNAVFRFDLGFHLAPQPRFIETLGTVPYVYSCGVHLLDV